MDDDIDLMIEDCFKRENKLNDWERKFLYSISEQKKDLSPAQEDKLTSIWDKVTSK